MSEQESGAAGFDDRLSAMVDEMLGGWRPISEAPRDGARLLMFRGDDPRAYLASHGMVGRLYVVGCWDVEHGGWVVAEPPFAPAEPTHWQRLPAAPC